MANDNKYKIMLTNRLTCVVPKRKASPLPNKLLRGKRPKSLAPSNFFPKTHIFLLSSPLDITPQDKTLLSPQINNWPPIDSFWESYNSNYVWDHLKESKDYNIYVRRAYYIYRWLDLFLRNPSGDEIIAAFSATMPKWYIDEKLQIKKWIEQAFEAAYQRLYHKLVNTISKYTE